MTKILKILFKISLSRKFNLIRKKMLSIPIKFLRIKSYSSDDLRFQKAFSRGCFTFNTKSDSC